MYWALLEVICLFDCPLFMLNADLRLELQQVRHPTFLLRDEWNLFQYFCPLISHHNAILFDFVRINSVSLAVCMFD